MNTAHSRIPIIKLWSILLVTLHGEINDEFARNLSSEILERIHREGASGLIVDITGLWILDSHLCSMVAELASAALLMGAKTLISGMSPDIAITLETMGVRLGDVVTTLDLESALQVLGVRVVKNEDEDDEVIGRAAFQEADPGPLALGGSRVPGAY